MMPSRSALVLVSCVTCLSSGPSAVGGQSNGYGTKVEKATANLILTSQSTAIVAQATSPSPSPKNTLSDVLPTLDSNKKTPAAKPKAVAKPVKSNWPLWWIGIGAVLVVVAGGLLYFLTHPGEEKETVATEPSSKQEAGENGEGENSNTVTNDPHLNNYLVEGEQNGYNAEFRQIAESQQLEELTPPPNANGRGNVFSPISEDRKLPEQIPTPPPNVKSQTNSFAPISENKEAEEPAPPPPEALEVREPTRLAKINIIDELIKELQNPDPTKRRKAIWELAQRGDSRAMQPLVELLMDADSKQRSLILEALSQIGTRTLKPMNRALAISLQDENAEVRKNAIRDLTRIYDMMAQVTQLLRYAVDDPDMEVQETARWALNQLGRIRGISGVDKPNWPNSKNSSDN